MYLIPVIIIFFTLGTGLKWLISVSAGPPDDRVKAPSENTGDSSGCATSGCHTGGTTTNNSVDLALTGLPAGLSSPEINLPDIHMEDIGAEDEGAPMSETVAGVISTVTAAAVSAVGDANIEGLAGDVIDGGLDLLGDVGSAIKKGISSLFGGGDDEDDEEEDDGGN